MPVRKGTPTKSATSPNTDYNRTKKRIVFSIFFSNYDHGEALGLMRHHKSKMTKSQMVSHHLLRVAALLLG